MINAYKIEMSKAQLKDAYSPFIDQVDQTILRGIISPDDQAPIIRNNLDGAELALSRWGMPTPEIYVKGEADIGITQVKNVETTYWRKWLSVDHRCLIPANAFAKNVAPDKATPEHQSQHWFALNKTQPLFFFAGIWTEWIGIRKASEGEQSHTVFAFLTTEMQNSPTQTNIVPLILTEPDAWDIWMTAEWKIAKLLQRPLPNGMIINL